MPQMQEAIQASLGGWESSPGAFFLFALISGALCSISCVLGFTFNSLGLVLLALFLAMAAILGFIVCLWEFVLTNLEPLDEQYASPPFDSGRCQYCGHSHFVWPWSL